MKASDFEKGLEKTFNEQVMQQNKVLIDDRDGYERGFLDGIHSEGDHYQSEIKKIIEKIGLTYHYERQHIIEDLQKLITNK